MIDHGRVKSGNVRPTEAEQEEWKGRLHPFTSQAGLEANRAIGATPGLEPIPEVLVVADGKEYPMTLNEFKDRLTRKQNGSRRRKPRLPKQVSPPHQPRTQQ